MTRSRGFKAGMTHLLAFVAAAAVGVWNANGAGSLLLSTSRQGILVPARTLAFAFAPAKQAEAVISSWHPPSAFADIQARFEKFQLAVLATTEEERGRRLSGLAQSCTGNPDSCLDRFLRRVAQTRLVPPGNDLECFDCNAAKRKPLPPPP
jgi:hypothetical protein